MNVPQKLFSISDVLGLRKHMAILVLDGWVYHLERGSFGRGEPNTAELYGSRRRITPVDKVDSLCRKAFETRPGHKNALDVGHLVSTAGNLPRSSNSLKAQTDFHNHLLFVFKKLIPRFRQLAGKERPMIDRTPELGCLLGLGAKFEILPWREDTPVSVMKDVLPHESPGEIRAFCQQMALHKRALILLHQFGRLKHQNRIVPEADLVQNLEDVRSGTSLSTPLKLDSCDLDRLTRWNFQNPEAGTLAEAVKSQGLSHRDLENYLQAYKKDTGYVHLKTIPITYQTYGAAGLAGPKTIQGDGYVSEGGYRLTWTKL